MKYYPYLSIAENAKRNNCSEAAVRKHIKTRGIDRRYERKANIVNEIRNALQKDNTLSASGVAKLTHHSLNTIKAYWSYATEEKVLSKRDTSKVSKTDIRQLNNFYATHPSATIDILREEDFNPEILEPFCGVGTMAEVIRKSGYDVDAYDIVDRGYGKTADFFKTDFPIGRYDIISNPPYDSQLCDAIKKCISICKQKVALLFPLRYLSGQTRYDEVFRTMPPSRVYTYIDRIGIAKNADFSRYNDAGANPEIYAWYVWDKSYEGETILKWISNKQVEIR